MSFNIEDLDNLDIRKANDSTIHSLVHRFKEDGLSGDRVFRDRAILADNFYNGFQWDNKTLEDLRKKRLPALTFNIIKKVVEFLVGTQESNRKDITAKPVKNGTNSIASIFTKLIKDTITKNNGEHLLSEWFRQGCIKGRCFIHAYRDFTEDPWTGDLKIEVVDALDCAIDPLSKRYDLSDSKYLIIFKYQNRDEVLAEYPQHKKRLVNLRTNDEIGGRYNEELLLDGGGDLDADALNSEESRYTNRTQYRFRVQWSYIKNTERRWHLIDKQEVTDTILESKEAIDIWKEAALRFPDKFKVVERADKVLYLIKTIDDIVLERIREPFKNEDAGQDFYRNVTNKYPVIPFGAFFDNGRWQGVVDDLIDPQSEKNKLRSSVLHIISTTANSGWMWQDNSIDEDTKRTLRTNGGATGLDIEYTDTAPTRIPPAVFPDGIFLLAEHSNKDLNDISGVNAANLGVTTSQESGKLNELRQIQGITTNTGVYDNFDYSMKLLGELIIEVITSIELYSNEEVALVVEEFDIFEPNVMAEAHQILEQQYIQQNGRPFPSLQELLIRAEANDPVSQQAITQQYQEMMQQREEVAKQIAKQIVMSELHNLYKGRYGIAVAQSNFSPTVKNANMNMLLQLSAMMPNVIPPEYIIKQTDLPDKEVILNSIQQRQRQAQETAVAVERAKVEGQIAVERAKTDGKLAEQSAKTKSDVIVGNTQQ